MLMQNKIFIIAPLLLGVLFRLMWASDMEWKYDEVWMYEMAQAIANGDTWSWLGMRSGVNVRNPGMSIWPFSFFALFTDTPIGMVRWVMALNIVTIFSYFFLIKKRIKENERDIWLCGILLMSVSPMAVLFSRKIWAQDILPFFVFFIILGHLYRNKVWGILLWGAIGALVGQIHMSGFFFSFGLFISTLIYDRVKKQKSSWFSWWVVGSIIGTLPMIPWLYYLTEASAGGGLKWKNIYKFRFFYFWAFDAIGIHIRYALKKDFWEFIKYPFIFNIPTYLIAIAHISLIAIGAYKLKELPKYLKSKFNKSRFFKNWNEIDFYLFSCLIGLGLVMGFSGVTIHEHYMIIAYPFVYIWLAKILINHRRLFFSVIFLQAFITFNFLLYIHLNHGSEKGDYGMTYSRQLEKGIAIEVDLRK